jgi:hypothetical protein
VGWEVQEIHFSKGSPFGEGTEVQCDHFHSLIQPGICPAITKSNKYSPGPSGASRLAVTEAE